jgi:small GTP-binding protein
MGDFSVPFSFKAVLLGDSGVGKTSIVTRWTTGVHQKISNPTIGANHQRKRVVIDDRDIDLFIWDTAGQEQFQSLTPLYARSACVAILTASVTDRKSFENVGHWVEILSSATDELPPIVLAANKIDLRESAQITDEEIEAEYRSKFAGLFFVSAVTDEGINNLFAFAAQLGYRFAMTNRGAPASRLDEKNGEEGRGGCC